MKVLPINAGYYNMKSINGQIFKTRIEKAYGYNLESDLDVLTLEGETYVVGTGDIELSLDKTRSELTKICILNMLARHTTDKEVFKVILTTPPLVFDTQKKLLPKYLEGTYEVIHNKVHKKIQIDSVNVYPETITTYISNNENARFDNKKIIILDIGGLTTNGCLINEGSFSSKSIFTIENGMYHLDNKIAQYLKNKYYLTITGDDIEYFRKQGIYLGNSTENILEKEKNYIYGLYYSFIKEIMKQCELKKWDIGIYNVLITGGGGLILYNMIKNDFMPKAILSNNPIFDNLIGLEMIARATLPMYK